MLLDIENHEIKNLDAKYKELKKNNIPMPKIKLIGIGGAGCNIIGRFKREQQIVVDDFQNIIMIAMNTDLQALYENDADIKLQIGEKLTNGNGAGAKPSVGKESAKESIEEIRRVLQDTDLLFLVCGMGGGTGTGATPIVAQIAKELDIRTIAMVTTPYDYEGKIKEIYAKDGIDKLSPIVDILIPISNTKLVDMWGDQPLNEVYKNGDKILKKDILSICDIITKPSDTNIDFADLSSVIKDARTVHIGIGKSSGEWAVYNALMEAKGSQFDGANVKSVIVHWEYDTSKIPIKYVNDAMRMFESMLSPECNIIYGHRDNTSSKDYDVKVILISTGVENNENI